MKNILIVAGPSAVGKTTVAHRMLELDDRYEFVRSVTTRPCSGFMQQQSRGKVQDAGLLFGKGSCRKGGTFANRVYIGGFLCVPLYSRRVYRGNETSERQTCPFGRFAEW